MRVAVDSKTINKVKPKKNIEYIYVFDTDEPIENLKKTNLHCFHKDYVENVDVNLTDFDILSIIKTDASDDNWYNLPTNKEYKFAIIVPNYNNDHGQNENQSFLRNCIESVLNQSYKNFELIIVDDMSTDNSVQTIKSYKDKRIHLIQNMRKRYNGGSRNVGIEYAKTTDADYICFLDSDDWWKHNKVLEHINERLYGHDMMILGAEMLFSGGKAYATRNKFDTYEDVFFCINKVWCTAWSRVIKIDKIVYFCEDTLMEDRVWAYKQADNIEFNKIIWLNEIVYVWNRLNTTNSVSIVRNGIWNASAWCHIGHQLQLLENLKHTEFRDKIKDRIQTCIAKVNKNEFQQY